MGGHVMTVLERQRPHSANTNKYLQQQLQVFSYKHKRVRSVHLTVIIRAILIYNEHKLNSTLCILK